MITFTVGVLKSLIDDLPDNANIEIKPDNVITDNYDVSDIYHDKCSNKLIIEYYNTKDEF